RRWSAVRSWESIPSRPARRRSGFWSSRWPRKGSSTSPPPPGSAPKSTAPPSTFGETGGEPRQRVHVHLAPDLAEVDATAWSSGELDGALRSEARRRFDLGDLKGEAGSPLRLRIFHRPGGERILLLVLHHLVGDFWSLAVLLRDWAAL